MKMPICSSLFFLMCLGIGGSVACAALDSIQMSKNGWLAAHYSEETLPSLDFMGYVTFDGTTIQGPAQIEGYMHAQFAKFNTLFVKGHARIQDTCIAHNTRIEGKLLAINVDFKGAVVSESAKITLSHCRLPSLNILAIDSMEEQVVEKLGSMSVMQLLDLTRELEQKWGIPS